MLDDRIKSGLAKIAEVLHVRLVDESNLSFDSEWRPFADHTERKGPFAGARTGELIGFYLAQLMSTDLPLQSIFGSLILCSLDFAVDCGSLSPDIRALLDGFLKATAPQWDIALMKIEFVQGSGVDYLPAYECDAKSARMLFSEQFGLRFPAVDWAQANADASRLPEFLIFSEERSEGLSAVEKQSLFELILFSINQALLGGSLECDQRAERFLHESAAWGVWPTWNSSTLHPDLTDFLDGSSMASKQRELISVEFDLRWPLLNWTKRNAETDRLDTFLKAYLDSQAKLRPVEWYVWLGKLILESVNAATKHAELTNTNISLLSRFITEQKGEQDVNVATWLRTADTQGAAVVVRAIIETDGRRERWTDESRRFISEENGQGRGYDIEYCLNCLFGFPIWTGNQDWGYCNEDPNRVPEFLAFYLSLPQDDPGPAHFMLAELIGYSLDKARETSLLSPDVELLAKSFFQTPYAQRFTK